MNASQENNFSMEQNIKDPLVSIIIPTYNRAYTLTKAINSVIKQKYTNWELIIVDDNSTDETKDLVDNYIKTDKRIRYFLNQRCKGVSGARNHGIINSSGDYLAFLDSDDEWVEHHLSKSVETLKKYNLNVCFSLVMERKADKLYRTFDQPDESNKLVKAINDLNAKVIDNVIFFDEDFYEYAVINELYCYHICTMVFNSKLIKEVGLFNEEFWGSEDIDFATRVIMNHKICLIRDCHFIYNQGNNDNLYFFVDRRNIDFDKMINDKSIVNKLVFCGYYHVKFRKNRIKYITNATMKANKDACIKAYQKQIAKKYFTLGFVCKKLHRFKALYFYIKSIWYEYENYKIKFIINTCFPFLFKNLKIDMKYINLF